MRRCFVILSLLLIVPGPASSQGVVPEAADYEAVDDFSAVITEIDRAAGTATLIITDPLREGTVRGAITFDPDANEGDQLLVNNRYELRIRRSNRFND